MERVPVPPTQEDDRIPRIDLIHEVLRKLGVEHGRITEDTTETECCVLPVLPESDEVHETRDEGQGLLPGVFAETTPVRSFQCMVLQLDGMEVQ